MKAFHKPALLLLALAGCTCFALALLEPGDLKNLQHKNIVLRPNDSLQVYQKGALGNLNDTWKGKEESVKDLLQE